MKYGVFLPINLPTEAGSALREFAQTAEGLGFDSLWTGDHVAIPRDSQSAYPYPLEMAATAIDDAPQQGASALPGGIPDPLGLLVFAAACTERVNLGTTVLVLPMRNPVITAQAVATLDVVSDGRAILGVGVGWNREEFQTLNATFERRGARTDDYLEVMRRLWTLDDPTYRGEHYQIGNVKFDPKPVQKPHPPYWFGGNEEPALRRAVRFGGTWHFAFLGPDAVRPRAERLRELTSAAGDDPSTVAVTGLRPDLIERPSREACAEVRALEEIGVSHLVVGVPGELSEFYPKMKRFSTDVIRHDA